MKENENMNNSDSNTFDYNQLYNGENQSGNVQPELQPSQSVSSDIINAPIVFEDEQKPREVVEDVIPTFDTSVLEELPEDLKPTTPEEPLINSMTKESQQEKEQQKRNIMFIAILFIVLIVAVWLIFPLLLDI